MYFHNVRFLHCVPAYNTPTIKRAVLKNKTNIGAVLQIRAVCRGWLRNCDHSLSISHPFPSWVSQSSPRVKISINEARETKSPYCPPPPPPFFSSHGTLLRSRFRHDRSRGVLREREGRVDGGRQPEGRAERGQRVHGERSEQHPGVHLLRQGGQAGGTLGIYRLAGLFL